MAGPPEGPLVSVSLLGCDHGRLAEAAVSMERAGADMIHLDVMDGVFVPVLTFGAGVAASLGRVTDLPLDAHLMVERPEGLVDAFAEAGCRYVTVHAEATSHLEALLSRIRDLGCLAGVSLNPSTPPDCLRYLAPVLDMVLVMSVNPGYAGQEHLPHTHGKIAEIREILDETGSGAMISVDGGVDPSNARRLTALGTDILVSGSFVTGSAYPEEAIAALRG